VTQRSPLPTIRRIVNRSLFGWLSRWPRLTASTAGQLARLRVFQRRVLAIDEMLRYKIVGIVRADGLALSGHP
jgi:hypothetical protein